MSSDVTDQEEYSSGKCRDARRSLWAKGDTFWGYLLSQSPPARKSLPQVRKPNLHSDHGQDSNPCACRPLGPQSTHGSSEPRRPQKESMVRNTVDKKKNIVIFGLNEEEEPIKSKKEKGQKKVAEDVVKTVQGEGENWESEIEKVHRLGKYRGRKTTESQI
ncbi:hypothetical protein E2C01_012016 [Portunus trituberculatus]|uniref:Uncharacterized protein n=1 Tax=Portunus trituberculatus TaxID=210409 RepID=A0A5B7DCU3_PORTR|nr:hypothetical protein [Portunus trituberculatus]